MRSGAEPLQEPVGRAPTSIAQNPLAVDPVSAAHAVLDPVVVAQPGASLLTPPFWRDAFRAFYSHDLMHTAPPAKLPGVAVWTCIKDRDFLRSIEQFQWPAVKIEQPL